MRLRIEWSKCKQTGRNIGIVKDEQLGTLCYLRTWGFSSCAVWMLDNFITWNFNDNRFDADQFWEFFKTKPEGLGEDWLTCEVYFLLADPQLGSLKKLIEHPNVRKRDKFLNKAHGPNRVHLFRWSNEEDFPHL